MPNPRPNLSPTGWIRFLPAPGIRAYLGIWVLTDEGQPPRGDLNGHGAETWVEFVAPQGLDAPYDPSEEEGDEDEIRRQQQLWEEWRGYASSFGRPMTNCRDVIEFMIELGLIKKPLETDGRWAIVSQVRNVEDVLPLSAERREQEALIRWKSQFHDVEQRITHWLSEKRATTAERSEIEISIDSLAAELNSDPEDVRHGLAILLDDDVQCDLDPETAASDATLRFTIDWELFENWRTIYRASPPEDQES